MLDDKFTELAVLVCLVTLKAYRRNLPLEFTDADLDELDELLKRMKQKFARLLPDVNLNTAKFHKLSHMTESMHAIGHLREVNADFYEHDHMVDKRLYRQVFF